MYRYDEFDQDFVNARVAEFSDQVESLRFLSRNFMAGPVPTLAQAIEIVDAAPAAIRSKRKDDDVVTVDEAWHKELGAEFLLARPNGLKDIPHFLDHRDVFFLTAVFESIVNAAHLLDGGDLIGDAGTITIGLGKGEGDDGVPDLFGAHAAQERALMRAAVESLTVWMRYPLARGFCQE